MSQTPLKRKNHSAKQLIIPWYLAIFGNHWVVCDIFNSFEPYLIIYVWQVYDKRWHDNTLHQIISYIDSILCGRFNIEKSNHFASAWLLICVQILFVLCSNLIRICVQILFVFVFKSYSNLFEAIKVPAKAIAKIQLLSGDIKAIWSRMQRYFEYIIYVKHIYILFI